MAASDTGASPLDIALMSLGAKRSKPASQATVKDAFDGLARETNVPANVLLALDEAEGGTGDLDRARSYAAVLGERLTSGVKLEDAISELAGDPERGAALMNRSYDIADALYGDPAPEPAAEEKSAILDLPKLAAGGAVSGTGGAIQHLGALADDALRGFARSELEASGGDPLPVGETPVRSASRTAANAVRGAGDDLTNSVSDKMKAALEGTQPGGELLSPSTWTMGEDPSIRGIAGRVAQGLGSMAPILATRNPYVAAATGALMAGGEGAQEGRDLVEGAQGAEGEFGPAYIESMPGYRELRGQGLSHDDAAAELSMRAESEAGARQAVFGALGGAATNRIMRGADGVLNAGGRAARAVKKGAAGAVEEGLQEAAEGMAAKSGIADMTGADVNTQQDSFGNFVLGALSGGAMGGAAGALGGGDVQPAEPDREFPGGDAATPETLMLPAPEHGGTIIGESDRRQDPFSFERDPSNPKTRAADQSGAGAQFRPDYAAEASRIFNDQPIIDGEFTEISPDQNTIPDGSGDGAVAAPGNGFPSLSADLGAVATNLPALPAPTGPIERAAQSIVSATPAPAPEFAPSFPEYKPGSAIKLGNLSTGAVNDAVFIGETPEGNAQVRVQGQVFDLTPQEFDALRDAAPRIEAERKEMERVKPGASDLAAQAQAGAAPEMRSESPATQEARRNPTSWVIRNRETGEAVMETFEKSTAARVNTEKYEAVPIIDHLASINGQQKETSADVEAGIAGQAPGLAGDGASVRLDDAGARGGEGFAPGRAAEPQGRQEGQGVAGSGMPAGREGQRTGHVGVGGLDMADDAGQLRRSLNEPDPAVDDSARPVRAHQTGLSPKSEKQAVKADAATGNLKIEPIRENAEILRGWEGTEPPTIDGVSIKRDDRAGGWVFSRKHSDKVRAALGLDQPEAINGEATAQIEAAAAEAAPEPTEAQKEAGNYRKGHARWNGLDLSIENAKGSERRGTGRDGAEWSVTMPADYGYFRGTEGADGDHVDFYMGDNPDAANAYVIDQVDAETGAYDEAKVMLGYDSAAAARAAHEAGFSDGKGAARMGGIKKMPISDLKSWLTSDATKKPVSMRARRAADKPAPAPQKRPLIHYVTTHLGGINPTGKVAEELRHRGVNARTAPGLWRRAGHKDLDNIPAQDHPDIEALVGRADDRLYLNPERIIEAIVEEVAGRPQPLGEQAVLQQQAQASEEAADHARRQEVEHDIVPLGDDPRPDDERRNAIEAAVDAFLAEYAPGHLTEAERADMIESLVKDGGPIAMAVDDAIMRRPLDDTGSAESEAGEVPFGDADGGERSDQISEREGGSEPAGDDPRRTPAERGGSAGEGQRDGVAPAIEAGAEGEPQTVIPGTERSAHAAANESAKADKIEDFGEKISGARKDIWSSYADEMRGAADVDVSAAPLSKSWPTPDYEKLVEAGVETWKVSFIRAARDSIPTKPQKAWRLKGWVDAVTAMRGLAQDAMDGRIDQDKLRNALLTGGVGTRSEILGQMKLYEAVGHSKSLKGMTFGEVKYSMLAGVRYEKPKAFWEVSQKAKATAFSNMPRTITRAETEAEALEQFKRAYGGLDQQQAKASKARKWLIYSHDGRKFFTVGTKIGSTYIQLRRVDDVKEARRIIAEEADALQEQLDRLREIPADRKPENAPRVGIDHRGGADVTPEVFGETFGFRGVQFGNWVGGERRQQDLNDAFDALMDLSGVLDVPPRALSLNGTLGLAFGARGSGGVSPAAAHYEPDQVVINLTKMNGAGSLAHEWFHALDNYFARAATDKRGNYITDRAVGNGARVDGVRPEVMNALVVLRHTIDKTGLKTRSANIDKTRSKGYWSTGIEMHARAFESYVIAKLQDQSIANDYLANVVEGTIWQMKAELSGLGDSYPYLKPDEIEVVRPAFDALFNAIQARETDRGVELFQRDLSEPVAMLTGDELGEWSDIRQLGKKAQAWYRKNLTPEGAPVSVTNTETGWAIEFNKKGASKIGGRKGEYLYRAVVALPDILRLGKLVGTETDSKGRPDIKAVHKLAAKVRIAGRDMNLITTIRETRDGKFHYDLSKDRAGGEGRSETALRHGDAKLRSSALEGALADLNLDFVDAEINPVPTSALRGLAETVTAVMRQHGLEGRISPKVVRVLLTASGVPVHGSYRAGEIKVSADSRDATRTARHEIIHALRDAALWGRPYGLFTAEEWRALVKAARADAAIRARVEAAYADLDTAGQSEEADLDTAGQSEEMVAELYADWAQGRREAPAGALSRALDRIRSFFRAVASALRGEGFQDAARIMERIASGEVGGRGPDGPGGAHEGDGDVLGQRRPLDLESALIGGDLGSISSHPDYAAAKAGDIAAAVRVAIDIVSDDMVQRVRQMIGNNRPVIVPVVSEEASGRNKIPRAASEVLAQRLGLNASTGIVQSNTPKRTALSGLDRIFSSPEFDGPVMEGQDYLILDDTLTQGGTFAALSGHIEAGGGRVIGAVALTGKQYSAKLRPSDATLSALREKHGDLENDFRAATGYGFDSLTESEARYLTNFKPADAIRDRILAEGRRRSRRQDQGDDPAVKHQRDMEAIKAQLSRSKGRALGMFGAFNWRKTPEVFSNLLTDAMGRNDRMNILSLVPGNALFEELAKGLPAAAKYLGEKRAMDAWRNDWQARAATLVDGWTKIARKNPVANDALMDLMHSTTLSGVDPTRPDSWRRPVDGEASRVLKDPMASAVRADWARTVLRAADDRRQKWDAAKTALDALPAEFREMYEKARDGYAAMADEQESALMQNIRAAARIALKRARREHKRELERIKDEGLTGEERNEAIGKANEKLTRAEARAARGDVAHLKKLRQMFETNRLEGPYFPLARFGNYFVTIRDDKGKVVSFSRFETASKQQDWIKTATERGLGKISHGTLNNLAEVRAQVDPAFVGEIEALLDEAGADDGLMDAVWQQWLQTLPDQSVRTARIHRKGRMGFNKDAIRAYSSAMFHGAHQTARLRHGMEMADALEDADEQAKTATDPNRAGFVVREMRQRHEFTMNPTNNPIVAGVSGAAFVWYLGMSPAAALVNLSQTTIVGVPLLAARFRGAGVQGAIKELGRASRDFAQGRDKSNRWGTWSLENSPRLSDEEKAAVKAGYNRGVIDKTQSHDLASVAESGLEHSPAREKVMRVISWGFHHTERMNREVTYLAAYRMARAEGMGQAQAIDEASRQVWKTHFDYQNTSRPRIMQGDLGKVLTTFRNFTVNMLYRLFRDTHQAFAGADAATRREARHQLVGITLSMFAHAGIRGVWGYGLLTMLLGLAFGADDDDVDEFLQDALLIEGDGPGVAAWNWTMGMALNGVPGQVTGLSLTGRIGMPDLWFRSPLQEVEGKDLWAHYTEQLLGPGFGIGGNVLAGLSMVQDGKYMRGLEKMVPIFAGNALKSGRYISEGVTTYSGDPIIESVNPYQALVQAAGFTPAKVAERYDINSRLKRHEKDVLEDRKGIMREIGDAVRAGNPIPAKTVEKMRAFNAKWPEYPITADGIKQSLGARQRATQRNEFGVVLNPKLNDRLRGERAPALYN